MTAYTLTVPSFVAKVQVGYAVQPGSRVVWCLKRRTTDVRCVMMARAVPVEVHVVHGSEMLMSEIFQEEWMALKWARAYRERLRAQGWDDVPGSSAAS